jgi:hypothetical protein
MPKITNITGSPRGFFHNGAMIMFAPGQTREDLDLNEKGMKAVKNMPESFKIGATKKEIADAEQAAAEQEAANASLKSSTDAEAEAAAKIAANNKAAAKKS